jgi:hypothetical protein
MPEWRGEDLAGKTLLLSAEQGLGDTIQFSRFASVLSGNGARIVLQTQPALALLLARLEGAPVVVPHGAPLPAHDVRCALLSVPSVLGLRQDTIPAPVPYLSADPARIATWRETLASHATGFRIGIAWRGRPSAVVDQGRSIALREMLALARIPGVRLISLQKDVEAEERSDLNGAGALVLPGLDDGADAFLDTAAVMASLDLVVTSDTAIAHLAGALGRPVWVALKAVPEWRWLREREDSPWYPTMRLYRQSKAGDWSSVFERIARDAEAASTRA